jgi:hypothetical protein
MLAILERVVWALSGLVLLAFGAALYFVGLPSTTPLIATGSKVITQAELDKRLTAEQRQRLAADRSGYDFDDKGELVARSGARKPQDIIYQVDEELLDRLGSKNDCMNELMLASSEILEDGSLKIFDIKPGCLLAKVGLKDDDILERVNGLKIDFSKITECQDSWETCLEKLEGGSAFVVELRRNGAVHQLVVTPGL